ncbi:MAG TPA: FKBP-type peptidyl-prolyl cis-trans isomerase [Conexibacter sp.]|nr:FKBP-type peptidyl-prolyl cis-trans isomerase [Conexibacter sp.]
MLGGLGGRTCLAVGCALAALIAGCGSGTQLGAPRAASRASSRPATTQSTTPAAAPEAGFAPNPYHELGSPGPHPGAHVTRLIVREIKRGSGPAVRPGDSVYADYIEANYITGLKFLRAWDHHRFGTENMLLRVPDWMEGLVQGMTGMRPGGRRVIIVPPRLSDHNDTDRRGRSLDTTVYWDVVLRKVDRPNG